MAVINLHYSLRLILSRALRCAPLSQQVIGKSNYSAPAKQQEVYNRVSSSMYLNTTHQNTHFHQLSSFHIFAMPLPRLSLLHCRTIHTSSACCLTAVSPPLLSSRRGRLSNLDDAKQYVSSLTVVQRATLETALQEARSDMDEVDNATSEQGKSSSCNFKFLFSLLFLPLLESIFNLHTDYDSKAPDRNKLKLRK